MTQAPKVAIVAALEREVHPLVKNWRKDERDYSGRRFRFFESADAVVVCGGIGAQAARRATEAVIQLYCPEVVVSAGFAGALRDDLQVASVVTPRMVIDASDGSRTDIGSGAGILISCDSVADAEKKGRLAKSYGADAVDMEAAAVARGAETRGVRFMAIKAISDVSDATLPPVSRFVTQNGQFQSGRFALHAAVRPWIWGSVLSLASNSAKASRALCQALAAVHEMRTAASEPVLQAPAAVKS
jgi:adenosylhomocysteine nucleosidase